MKVPNIWPAEATGPLVIGIYNDETGIEETITVKPGETIPEKALAWIRESLLESEGPAFIPHRTQGQIPFLVEKYFKEEREKGARK